MSSAVRGARHRVALRGVLTTLVGVAIVWVPWRVTIFMVHLNLAGWTSPMEVRFTHANTTFLGALAIIHSVMNATVIV